MFALVTGRHILRRAHTSAPCAPHIRLLCSRHGSPVNSVANPEPSKVDDAWVEVKDEGSGQYYWWNKMTNETTHLGAPRPQSSDVANTSQAPPPAQQGGGMMSEFGSMVAQGMAFGAGSSIAHNVIGSIFGGSSGHDDHPDDDGVDI